VYFAHTDWRSDVVAEIIASHQQRWQQINSKLEVVVVASALGDM